MTTSVTLHADVQRSRFIQHALAALSGLIPSALRAPTMARAASESAAIEARNVRNLAHACARSDPGFAADLYAAAARHEGQHAG
ncbi:MAG: hypothetical protein ACSLE9_04460 [Burkholderiaceae bacterium]